MGGKLLSAKKRLTQTEQSVIDYIAAHPADAAQKSITELADETFTSPATVSRAIRKCGYSGIPELRRELAVESNRTDAPYRVNHVLELSYLECTKTIENLRIQDILKTVEYIRQARRILVVARGVTGLTAQEFQFHLQLLGYIVQLVTDSEILKLFDCVVDSRDMVMIFTAYNSTPELAIAAEAAKKKGCHVVTCCCQAGTSLEPLSDIVMVGNNSLIVEDSAFNGASRLPLQIMSRTIIEYLGICPKDPQETAD